MKHIARSTLIVAVFFGLEKILGFLRYFLIARQFGLSSELDAFNAANNIPDLIFSLISGGALALAFIPVLTETRQKEGRPESWVLFSQILNLVFVFTAGLSLLVALFAPFLVRAQIGIVPGFNPHQQALVVQLMRLNLIATLLFSLGGLAIAGLQSNQHFWLPAIAPSMVDLGSLFGVIILAPTVGYRLGSISLPAYHLGVYGLVYGIIIGAAFFLIIQIPGLFRYQFKWSPGFGLKTSKVNQVLRLMGPRVMTMLFINLVFVAQDNLASRLSAGAITALVYGWLFMQVPETLIGTAIGTVLLPTLSEQVAVADQEQFQSTLSSGLKIVIAFCLPLILLLSIVIRPVVAVLGFDADGTTLVTWTARAFLLGLIGHSLLEVAARAFYAKQNARTPMIASFINTVLFILSASLLAKPLGAAGIALANTLSFTTEASLLWILLSRQRQKPWQIRSTLTRATLAAGLSGAAAYAVQLLPLPHLLLAIAAGCLGILIAVPWVLPEVKILLHL
ncbi:MAG: murein biosynthesis integral membrane protein MurJ [Anaerolineales bacterium]